MYLQRKREEEEKEGGKEGGKERRGGVKEGRDEKKAKEIQKLKSNISLTPCLSQL